MGLLQLAWYCHGEVFYGFRSDIRKRIADLVMTHDGESLWLKSSNHFSFRRSDAQRVVSESDLLRARMHEWLRFWREFSHLLSRQVRGVAGLAEVSTTRVVDSKVAPCFGDFLSKFTDAQLSHLKSVGRLMPLVSCPRNTC